MIGTWRKNMKLSQSDYEAVVACLLYVIRLKDGSVEGLEDIELYSREDIREALSAIDQLNTY